MVKKAVIFDLDGTLVNSIPVHLKRHQQIFKTFNVELTEDFFELHCNGSNEREIYEKVLLHYQGNLKNFKQAWKINEETRESILDDIKVFPGVKSTLQKLKKNKYKIAVASSSDREYITRILNNNNITHYFESITGGDEVEHTKPDPHIFLLSRKKINMKKSDCVIIEDTINGARAAKNANIDVICVLTSEKEEDLPKYVTIAPKHTHLFELISQMN